MEISWLGPQLLLELGQGDDGNLLQLIALVGTPVSKFKRGEILLNPIMRYSMIDFDTVENFNNHLLKKFRKAKFTRRYFINYFVPEYIIIKGGF